MSVPSTVSERNKKQSVEKFNTVKYIVEGGWERGRERIERGMRKGGGVVGVRERERSGG